MLVVISGSQPLKQPKKATVDDILVMELSSFQLLGITKLHPKIAVLTNIYKHILIITVHVKNYVKAKMRLLKKSNKKLITL